MEGRKQTLPSTRAHCPPGGQHNEPSFERQHCPAYNKGGAQFDAKDQGEQKLCPVLLKSNIGLIKEINSRKKPTNACHKVRTHDQGEVGERYLQACLQSPKIKHGTMRKQGTRPYFGAKKTKKKSNMCLHRVSSVGLHLWHITLPSTRAGQHLVMHGQCTNTHAPRELWHSKHARAAESGAPKNSVLPSTRTGQHLEASTHQARTHKAARTISCPALHKGRAASWELLLHGLKLD
ncbi:uncharacterized protein DS421_2g48730 [Arachis hypogaea]|nr:uncharacterized protein DS421_2g48730 [Arachis hypogaea]